MEVKLTKTKCSYCSSEYVTAEQYDENFEIFKAATGYTRQELYNSIVLSMAEAGHKLSEQQKMILSSIFAKHALD